MTSNKWKLSIHTMDSPPAIVAMRLSRRRAAIEVAVAADEKSVLQFSNGYTKSEVAEAMGILDRLFVDGDAEQMPADYLEVVLEVVLAGC